MSLEISKLSQKQILVFVPYDLEGETQVLQTLLPEITEFWKNGIGLIIIFECNGGSKSQEKFATLLSKNNIPNRVVNISSPNFRNDTRNILIHLGNIPDLQEFFAKKEYPVPRLFIVTDQKLLPESPGAGSFSHFQTEQPIGAKITETWSPIMKEYFGNNPSGVVVFVRRNGLYDEYAYQEGTGYLVYHIKEWKFERDPGSIDWDRLKQTIEDTLGALIDPESLKKNFFAVAHDGSYSVLILIKEFQIDGVTVYYISKLVATRRLSGHGLGTDLLKWVLQWLDQNITKNAVVSLRTKAKPQLRRVAKLYNELFTLGFGAPATDVYKAYASPIKSSTLAQCLLVCLAISKWPSDFIEDEEQ